MQPRDGLERRMVQAFLNAFTKKPSLCATIKEEFRRDHGQKRGTLKGWLYQPLSPPPHFLSLAQPEKGRKEITFKMLLSKAVCVLGEKKN